MQRRSSHVLLQVVLNVCIAFFTTKVGALLELKRYGQEGHVIESISGTRHASLSHKQSSLTGSRKLQPSFAQTIESIEDFSDTNSTEEETGEAFNSKYEAAEKASSDSTVYKNDDEDLYYIDRKGRRKKKGVGSMTRAGYHKIIRSSRWFNPEVTREYELDWWFRQIEFNNQNSDQLSQLMEERRNLNLQRYVLDIITTFTSAQDRLITCVAMGMEDNIFFIRTGQSEIDLKVRVVHFPTYVTSIKYC